MTSSPFEIHRYDPAEVSFTEADLAAFLKKSRAWREGRRIGDHDIFALPERSIVVRQQLLADLGGVGGHPDDMHLRSCTLAEADNYVQTHVQERDRLRALGTLTIPRSTIFIVPQDPTLFSKKPVFY